MNLPIIFFSFIAGLFGSMGFGGGTFLLIYLSVILSLEQTKAQGINLMFFIPYAIYAIIRYIRRRLIKKEQLLPVIIPGLVGAAAGYALIDYLKSAYLKKAFGAFLIVLALREILPFVKRLIAGIKMKKQKK